MVPSDRSQKTLHGLAAFNARRLLPGLPTPDWQQELHASMEWLAVEQEYLSACRQEARLHLEDLPAEPESFIQWFSALRESGPGQWDPLFPWLAHHATWIEMRWFIAQEIGGEAGFDDLVALTQVKCPMRGKLEMARNYWDEMGHGLEQAAHGPLLQRVAKAFDLQPQDVPVLDEAVALNNLMMGLACNRRYAYQAIGALGVIELTAPSRVALVAQGLARLGLPKEQRLYYDLHASLDVRHAQSWMSEILLPLVTSQPETAPAIAEGALMRLCAGQRCFQRFRSQFGLTGLSAAQQSSADMGAAASHHISAAAAKPPTWKASHANAAPSYVQPRK